MNETEICRNAILSEDYRDFIGNYIRTPLFDRITENSPCIQDAGFGYTCYYVESKTADPVTLPRYSYNSIPKCYAPLSMDALNESGILPIQNYPTLQLKGAGILLGFLDSGIDFTSRIFRRLDGSTRILAIWDQTVQSGALPSGFAYGSEYTEPLINRALQADDPYTLVPTRDETGHGTYCASLAAGGADEEERFLGAAPESSIAVVKLKQAKKYLRDYYFIPDDAVCYQETDLILGLKYLNDLADSLNLPLVVCFTCGTSMGGHVGTLPLPLLLDGYNTKPNRISVTGTGNEAGTRHHFSRTLTGPDDSSTAEIRVGENVSGFSMELWTEIPDILSITIISPSGESTSRIPFLTGTSAQADFIFENTKVSVDYRLLVEKTTSELIFFRFDSPAAGIWKIITEPVNIADGKFHIWLPLSDFLDGEVYFLEPDPDCTLLNPSDASGPIVVSYYNGTTGAVSQNSGRGYTRSGKRRPDLTAPGINVTGALPDGRFGSRSGSCIAAAITAGAVALILEWLLKNQNAPGIDSFQIRSLLILGAVRPDTMNYPNREWGYGQLNLYNTFETIRRL